MLWKPWRDETELIGNHASYESAFNESGLEADDKVLRYQKGKADMAKAVELIRKAHLTEGDIEFEADEEQDDDDAVDTDELEKRMKDIFMPVNYILS